MDRLRPIGPPTERSDTLKDRVINEMGELKVAYNLSTTMEAAGQQIAMPHRVSAKLTPDAWEYAGEVELKLRTAAVESPIASMALPTFNRMSVSLLKMGMLVAATRREYIDSELVVQKNDLQQAAWYIQKWGKYSIELISQAGKPSTEKVLERAYQMIRREPGILKSSLMRRMHITTRELKEIMDTLQDRGMVRADTKSAKGTRYYSVV